MARSSITVSKECESAAEETLQFDDDNLRAITQVYNDDGNEEYRKEEFSNAVYLYTEGIKVNCKDDKLKAELYSSRAAAHFHLGNYTESLSDATVAVTLNPSLITAFVHGASACIQLKKFEETITWCDKGLAIDPNNKKLLELRSGFVKEQKELNDVCEEKKIGAKVTYKADNIERRSTEEKKSCGNRESYLNQIDDHERQLKIAKQLGDRLKEAKAYGKLGIAHCNLGSLKTAVDYLESSLNIGKELGNRVIQGAAYHNLGIAHRGLGDFDTAIDYHERYLKVAKELENRNATREAYFYLAINHSSLGDLKTAIQYHERHLNIAKELENRNAEGEAYIYLAINHSSLGDLKTAIQYHERHLNIAKELGDESGEGTACSYLGIAHCKLGDLKKSIDYHESHLKISKKLGDRSGEGGAFSNLGRAYHDLGDHKTAIQYHERHLNIAKELGDESGEGTACNNLGISHCKLGDFKKGIDYYESQLNISKKLRDRSGEGTAYGNLGCAHHDLGDPKTAIQYHKRHLNIAKELGDESGEGVAYTNLGIAHFDQGDGKTAIDYHERGLEISKGLGDRSRESKACSHLAHVHFSLGDFETAIDYLQKHLKFVLESGDRSGEGRAYSGLGIIFHVRRDYKTAKDYHERHLEIAKELGDRLGEREAYCRLGNAHKCLGDLKTAIEYHERSLRMSKELGNRSEEGKVYGNLGDAYRMLGNRKTILERDLKNSIEPGNFETSKDYYERCLKIAKEMRDRSEEGKAYGNLGTTYRRLGDFQAAVKYHERQLKIAQELDDKFQEVNACSNLGADFESLSQFTAAIGYYQLGVVSLDNIRIHRQLNDEFKILLRNDYQKMYAQLWRLKLAEGNVTEALSFAEQGRAQGLKDLLELKYAFDRSDTGSGAENTTVNELFSSLPPNTVFLATGKNELNLWVFQRGKDIELRKKQIIFRDRVNTFFPSLFHLVLQSFSSGDFLKCEDRSLELAGDKSSEVKRSPADSRHTQYLDFEREALKATDDALKTLYDTIISPIQDLFLGSELIFVPEGLLWLVPFAAFKSPDSKYLFESIKIRFAPSLTSLKIIAECPLDYHHKTGALLVGDPLTELSPLPCAREEVQMIGKILGSTPLIGKQATKDEVLARLSSVALVHIAAHGNMETGEIALASTEGVEKVILTMRDVRRVQMRPRLVVLSCCHSAHGEIKAEGVVGIARAFLGAGARSVLVSLWAIDDEATLEFMKNFYRHLMKGKSASEALNQAMNCMRESEQFSAVKYWAPFVLIGDDVTLEFAGNEQITHNSEHTD